jgi:oligopeptide transport system substrate-binding protein
MYKFLAGWILTLAAVLLLTLRLGTETPADIVLDNEQEPFNLDPLTTSYHHDIRTLTGLFEGLARLNPKTLEPEPAGAESWQVSPDGRTYTFKLRPGQRWMSHAGGDLGEVTAHDFVWSWRRVLEPASESEYFALLFCIDNAEAFHEDKAPWEAVGVTAVSDYELRVRLHSPTPYFLELCAFPTLYPVHRPTVEADPKRWSLRPETFVSNGPFLLAERIFRRRLRVARNETYWDRERVKARTIDILPIDNRTTALLAYEAGYTDFVSKVPDEVARAMDRKAKAGEPRPDLHLTPQFRTYFYRFNCKPQIPHPDTGAMVDNPLAKPEVRRALSLAVDRRALADNLLGIGRPPCTGLVPPGSLVKYPGIPYVHERDYDPEKARRLLADAGYSGRSRFVPLVINFNKDELHEQVALFVREAWERELGVEVRLRSLDGKIFSQLQQNLNYIVCRAGWGGDYNDPMTFLEMFASGNGHNQTGWSHPEYDRLIESAYRDPDEARRLRTLRAAEELLIFEQQPIMPLYQYVAAEMVRPGLKGFHPNVREHMDISYLHKTE